MKIKSLLKIDRTTSAAGHAADCSKSIPLNRSCSGGSEFSRRSRSRTVTMASPGSLCACSYAHGMHSCPHHSPIPASVPSSPSALVSPRTPFGFSSRENIFSRSYSFHSGSSVKPAGRRWSSDSASRPPSLAARSSLTPNFLSDSPTDRLVFANEAVIPGRAKIPFSRSASMSASGCRFGEFESIREAEGREGAEGDGGDSPTLERRDAPTFSHRSSASFTRGSTVHLPSVADSDIDSRTGSSVDDSEDGRWGGSILDPATDGVTGSKLDARSPPCGPVAGAELAEAMAVSGTRGPVLLGDYSDGRLADYVDGRRVDANGGGGAVSARQRFPDFAEGFPRSASAHAGSAVLSNSVRSGLPAGSLSGLPPSPILPACTVLPKYSESAVPPVHSERTLEVSQHLPSSACGTPAPATSARATSSRAQPLGGNGSPLSLLNGASVALPLFHVREGFRAAVSSRLGGLGFRASSASASARLKRRVAAPAFAPFLKNASASPAVAPGTANKSANVTNKNATNMATYGATVADPAPPVTRPPTRRRPASSPSSAPPSHLRTPDLVAPPSLPARFTFPVPTLPRFPSRKAPPPAPPNEHQAPPALSPAIPHERQPAGRPRRLPAVHSFADGALAQLVPLAGSGPQVLQMLGGPVAWVRRFVVSMGLAAVLQGVSVVAAVTAAFYWAWWPIWRAVARNVAMRVQYRHAGLWKARLLDLQLVGSGPQARWRVLIGDHSRTTIEMDVLPPNKSVCLRRGDPVELLVLSDRPSLAPFRAAREIFFPQRSLWLVGEKDACIERSVFEEMRRKVALRAAVEDGEDSEGEDWDGLYSLLTDENEQLLQNYSYNESASVQSELSSSCGKGGVLGGGISGVGGFEGVAGGLSGGSASLGGFASSPENLGVKEEQEQLAQQGLLDYSAMDSAGSGGLGGFRDPALMSSFGGAGGGGSVGAVADGLAASSSCLMDGGGSGSLAALLGDSQDSELMERLREV